MCTHIVDNFKPNNQLTRTEGLTAIAVFPLGECHSFIDFPFSSNSLIILVCSFVEHSDVDLNLWRRNNARTRMPHVRSRPITPLFEVFQTSPTRPSDKNSIKVEMNMELWRKNIWQSGNRFLLFPPFYFWSLEHSKFWFPRIGDWFFRISCFFDDERGDGPLHQPPTWRIRWFLVNQPWQQET